MTSAKNWGKNYAKRGRSDFLKNTWNMRKAVYPENGNMRYYFWKILNLIIEKAKLPLVYISNLPLLNCLKINLKPYDPSYYPSFVSDLPTHYHFVII